MLAFKLLIRNWRSGELKLLSASLVLAVAVLSGISIFTDRLELTLSIQSNSVLGADTIVTSTQALPREWFNQAEKAAIDQSHAAVFMSMLYAGDEMHLASIKAIDERYPLRGEFEISDISYAENEKDIRKAKKNPQEGEAWVDSRLSSLLKINIGDKVAVGEYELTVTNILINEPDGVNVFSSLGSRLIMNYRDLEKTQIIQPGSRVEYQWLLASNNTKLLNQYVDELKLQLSPHQKIKNIESSQERLSNTLNMAKNFLLLTSVIALLLAGVAIAIAARQFSDRHTQQVAIMKSFGVSAARIRSLYFIQLFALGVFSALLGLLIGFLIQQMVVESVQKLYQVTLAGASFYPYILSFLSGLICIVCFALPALWFLPQVPPLKILRRELEVNKLQVWLQAGFALLAILLLVGLFSRDIKIALSASAALIGVVLIAYVMAWLLMWVGKKLILSLGGIWRLAFSGMQRRKGQSLVQIIVFSLSIMLLLTLTIIRTSLISDWQLQVPINAPNHYLSNMNAADVSEMQSVFAQHNINLAPVYPDVRGRLIRINNLEFNEEFRKKHGALQRELNLTWSLNLAAGNKIVDGQWWDVWKSPTTGVAGVSVEQDLAKALGLKLGDQLYFSIGGFGLTAEVASIRSVDWKSLKQNFFFIFEPYALDQFSPTYGTSIFIENSKKILLNQFSRNHPTVFVLDFGQVINNIKKIMNQVTDGVGLVFWLTLVSACLVLLAAVMSSIDNRKQEAGLLRALGSSQKLILGSVLIEFAILGFISGLIAIVGAEFLLFSLQLFVFKNPIQPHYLFWLASPLVGCLLMAIMGVMACRYVVTTPPAVVLRDAV